MKINKELHQKICEYLGCDLDSTPCQQVQEYLQDCHNCEVYVDQVKKTVKIYKTANGCDELPEDVCNKLFVTLKLTDLNTLAEFKE